MPVPVRHGMTIGELARYYNGEGHINAALTVVKMQGWQRGDWFDSTGLTWINPSPNLRSQRAAELYTGLGLIETSNISVGRGTDTPFELLGAPWIDARTLAARSMRICCPVCDSSPSISHPPRRILTQVSYATASRLW